MCIFKRHLTVNKKLYIKYLLSSVDSSVSWREKTFGLCLEKKDILNPPRITQIAFYKKKLWVQETICLWFFKWCLSKCKIPSLSLFSI